MIFVSSKEDLNGKLAFVEGREYLRHSDRHVAQVVQEWDEVARIVLGIIRMFVLLLCRGTTPKLFDAVLGETPLG